MSGDLAFNTSVSFITNTNLQHYSGETGLSYLGQLTLMLWQFISAGSGIAIAAVLFFAMKERATDKLGNFYFLFVRSGTRILFPIALVIAVLLVFNGTPMTFEGKDTITNVQGDTVQVSRGPVAAFVAIKQLGTNGGGFFGPNSAHPLENTNYFTNITETISIFLIPIAMIFALGYVLKRRKLAVTIFGVMTIGFLLLVIPTVINEMNGNPAIAKMGIAQPMGSMEGKEVRFGSAASAYWAINTTVTSNGSVNAMHDSFTPLSGMNAMLGMMVNCFYGGVGVGFLNFYIFIILAVFISGLMVGRTPEFLGKKIEAREMKIAMIIALLHPFLILVGTAITSHVYAQNPAAYASWLNNPGHHGFSEMLYEFTSSSANNGSGFEGLGDNTPFWNIATGVVMLLARYLPIIGPVALAGSLASKKFIPESAGTLKTDTATFGLMVFAVIAIVAALSFFPALALGPIAEYFSIR
jgi:K+-transporting ATPase ATPase A chain